MIGRLYFPPAEGQAELPPSVPFRSDSDSDSDGYDALLEAEARKVAKKLPDAPTTDPAEPSHKEKRRKLSGDGE